MKKQLQWLLALIVLCMPLMALTANAANLTDNLGGNVTTVGTGTAAADNIDEDLIGYNIFTPPVSDKSIHYLGEIFGTVGGIVHGASGQLLGEVFRVFNYGMVMVASLMLIYMVIKSVMDTASEGEFMGRQTKSTWTIFRAVMGIGILVPKYTGYSLVQVLIMWAVVQGVGLADKTWARAINYLDKGGVIFSDPNQLLAANRAGVQETLQSSINILQAETCMYRLNDINQQQRQNAQTALKNDPSNPTLQLQSKMYSAPKVLWNDDAKTVSFGIAGDTDADYKPVCGIYSWKKAVSPSDTSQGRTNKMADRDAGIA